MTTTHRRRLKKLADHLIRGKLGHARFSFSQWNEFPSLHKGPRNICGTSGCAVGECPVVFPRSWGFRKVDGLPRLRAKGGRKQPLDAAVEFFGLGYAEARHLFLPDVPLLLHLKRKRGDPPGLRLWFPGLKPDATAEEAGRNIHRFLETKKAKA